MACSCLSRHLEDRLLALDIKRDSFPWWRFRARRAIRLRQAAVLDVLAAAVESEQ